MSDSKFSPRLGLTFDPTGDGNWVLNGSYATYVSSLVNDIGNANSSAGSPAAYLFQYLGPAINTEFNEFSPAPTHVTLPSSSVRATVSPKRVMRSRRRLGKP